MPRERNRSAALEASRRWRAKYPERSAQSSLKWRQKKQHAIAGRPKPDFCEVCGRGGLICFDHCHTTGAFRGWLCNGCNAALGQVADDPAILLKLIAYLEQAL